METLLILNGTIITAGESLREDLVVIDGIISVRGNVDPAQYPSSKTIDATGRLILPGGIDPHVHFSLPTPAGNSSDSFFSGSRAAIAGGTTGIMDFVTPKRGESLINALLQRKKEAEACLTDYSLHMGISEWNHGIASEIGICIDKEGITSFKTYLAYRDSIGINEKELKQVMEIVGPAGGLVMVHCEDGTMITGLQQQFIRRGKTAAFYHALSRPPEAEFRVVEKVIDLGVRTGCPVYIVHVSTGKAAEAIRQAKKTGITLFAETCPQYLLLNDSVYDPKLENRKVLPYIISPPLRSSEDQEQLWEGLQDGTFDTLATDHCPFHLHGQKDQGLNDFTKIPNGAGGIEHRLKLLYTYGVLSGKMSINRLVDLVSTAPADIFGFGTRKGKLEPGHDADIVIWDPDAKGVISVKDHFQNCDSEIYEGFQVVGNPEIVLMNGKIAFQNNQLNLSGLKGHFIRVCVRL